LMIDEPASADIDIAAIDWGITPLSFSPLIMPLTPHYFRLRHTPLLMIA
jgi:hypothetical protein